MTEKEKLEYHLYISGDYMGRGLTPLDRYNNLHPDELHRDWLEKGGLEVQEDGTTKKIEKRTRGRPRGSSGRCGHCGEPGHYVRSCPELYFDVNDTKGGK